MSTALKPALGCLLAGFVAVMAPCVGVAAGESGEPAVAVPEGTPVPYALHGQSTFIVQGVPPFHARYKGDNSLSSGGETKETWTVTPAVGVRLGPGLEFYGNPEFFQGFGLDSTHGVAGFTNGEAQRGGTHVPEAYLARLFVRQTWGFGGESEIVADGFNQLGGTRDVSRLTLTAGKFSTSDIFDDNTYSHDPRAGFLNWSIWEAGAFDFAADLRGYTYGAVLDLNQTAWAFRLGYMLNPPGSGQRGSDPDFTRHGQSLAELETRYSFMGKDGKLRLMGWLNRANMGNYREALALVANTGVDINDTNTSNRKTRSSFGFVAGIEQAASEDVGLFARASWGNGVNESLSFTDIDQSVSAGFTLKGTAWGRPKDTVGVAGVVNGISAAHRDFFAAGGLGIVIGDGKLNYANEAIVETYYAHALRDSLILTFDGQYITNPAYNADRGPAGVLSARLHGEF